MRLITTATLLASILGPAFAINAINATNDSNDSNVSAASSEVAAIRTFFYVGGGYADDGAGGHIYREQMYVERLRSAKGVSQAVPIVFIHGQAQTGTVSHLFSRYLTSLILHPSQSGLPAVYIHISYTRAYHYHLASVTCIAALYHDSCCCSAAPSRGGMHRPCRDMLALTTKPGLLFCATEKLAD